MRFFPTPREWLRLGLVLMLFAFMVGGFALYMTSMPGKSFSGTLPPLTAEEAQIEANLNKHITYLAGEIGERNVLPMSLCRKPHNTLKTISKALDT